MSEKAQSVSYQTRERLWWYAVAAVNLGKWDSATRILDALTPDDKLGGRIEACKAFLAWRCERSPFSVSALVRLVDHNPANYAARGFLGLVHLESGLIQAAAQIGLELLGKDDETSEFFGRCIEKRLSILT